MTSRDSFSRSTMRTKDKRRRDAEAQKRRRDYVKLHKEAVAHFMLGCVEFWKVLSGDDIFRERAHELVAMFAAIPKCERRARATSRNHREAIRLAQQRRRTLVRRQTVASEKFIDSSVKLLDDVVCSNDADSYSTDVAQNLISEHSRIPQWSQRGAKR